MGEQILTLRVDPIQKGSKNLIQLKLNAPGCIVLNHVKPFIVIWFTIIFICLWLQTETANGIEEKL